MYILIRYALLLLLALFVFWSVRGLLQAAVGKSRLRARLLYLREQRFSYKFARVAAEYSRLARHVSDVLESGQFKLGLSFFMTLTLVLVLSGLVFGYLLFMSVKGAVSSAFLMGTIPYLVVRTKLISLQLKTRLEFLPAVEIFYQYYVLSVHKNVRSVLRDALDENRMPYPIKSVFEQLRGNLLTHRDEEVSLRLFTLSLGHVWAEHFASIVRMGLLEGIDVTAALGELIEDMRKAQRTDQADRNRLLEIRIANFTPIFFLAAFVFINFNINYESAYLYYVIDPAGRSMLLDALLLIVLSFLMGLYLSMKRM